MSRLLEPLAAGVFLILSLALIWHIFQLRIERSAHAATADRLERCAVNLGTEGANRRACDSALAAQSAAAELLQADCRRELDVADAKVEEILNRKSVPAPGTGPEHMNLWVGGLP